MVKKKVSDKNRILPKKVFILLTLTIVLGLFFVMALPQVFDFNTDNIITSNDTHLFEYNFTIPDGEGLQNVTWTWGETGSLVNYSMYDDSLVFFSNFDNRSDLGENDTHVKDLSKYGNNGTVIGDTFNSTGGKYNGAFEFNGTNNYIDIGSISQLNYTKDHSFILWIKPILNIEGSNNYFIISDDKDSGNKVFDFSVYDDGHFSYVYVNNAGGTVAKDSVFHLVSTNNWYMVSLVSNRTNNITSIYLNDNNVANLSLGDYSILGATRNIYISSRRGASNYFNGTIDEPMIFNRSLSASEISQIYTMQHTVYDSQNHSISFNESLVAGDSYDYQLGVSNSSGDYNWTTLNTITRNPIYLIANFSSSIGNIRSDFYGTNVQSGRKLVGGLILDTNCDGVADTNADGSVLQNTFLNGGNNILRMDMNLGSYYSNTSDSSGVNMTGNLNNMTDVVSFVNNNNLKILFVINYMPTWLADNSSGECNNLWYCPPSNFTKFNNIVLDYLNRVTSNGIYNSSIELEFWNEPYGNFFMGGLGTDDITKALNYTYFYNKTYDGIKAVYPNIPFGGPSGYEFDTSPNLYKTFWTNLTTKSDFISYHPYNSEYITSNQMLIDTQNLINNCSFYGGNCSRLIVSEWQPDSATLKNQSLGQSNEYNINIAYPYISILNNYPSNISMLYYHWMDLNSYFNCPSRYSEYPHLWSGFSYAGLDNPTATYYPPYNVTKNFANLCQPGMSVTQSTSDNSDFVTTACNKTDLYSFIVINKGTESGNLTLNFTGSPNNGYVMDSSNGNLYLTNDSHNIGILDSYGIQYLSTPTFSLNEATSLTRTATTGETYASSEVFVSSSSTHSRTITSTLAIPINTTITLDYAYCSNIESISVNGISVSYTCNSPLTFTGTLNPGTNSITITTTTVDGADSICASLGLGLDNVSSKLPIIFSIAGIILILGILGAAWVVYNGGDIGGIDVDFNLIMVLIMGVVGLIIVSIIALVITSTLCAI